jgi:hypothetical protein
MKKSITKKWTILFITLTVIAFMIWYWLLHGWYYISMIGNDARVRESRKEAIECLYPWQNVRILQNVLRPGTTVEQGQWYTAIYYEQVLPDNQLYRKLALYEGKNPVLDSCEAKVSKKYGPENNLDPNYPPVAMTIYEGNFVLQTTDDPNGGVPLEKLPLVFGPKDPIVTKK